MANGDSVNWSGRTTRTDTVTWETDYVASPAETPTASFQISEGDTPPTVAHNLETAWNKSNNPPYKAEATGAVVRFTDESTKNPRKVDGMRFTVAGSQTTPVPGNGTSVPVGNTGLSVNRA